MGVCVCMCISQGQKPLTHSHQESFFFNLEKVAANYALEKFEYC